MTALFQCPDCGREYRSDKLASCPGCGHEAEGSSIPRFASSSAETAQYDQLMVWAIDRTTHAVRSIAIFLFTMVCTLTLSTVLFVAGFAVRSNCSLSDCGDGGLQNFAITIAIVGMLAAIGLGIRELIKSQP